jgi:hypothetical protein
MPTNGVKKNMSLNVGSVSGVILRTFIDDRACLAFILQQSLNALASGKDLLNCLFASYLACQRIETGHITREHVQERHCTCVTEDDRTITEHFCMSCFALRPCSQMGRRVTDVDNLIECSACLELSGSERVFVPQNIQGIVRVGVLTTSWIR